MPLNRSFLAQHPSRRKDGRCVGVVCGGGHHLEIITYWVGRRIVSYGRTSFTVRACLGWGLIVT